MADPTPTPAVSPTGSPLVSPKLAPYLLAIAGLAGTAATLGETGVFGATASPLIAKIAEGLVLLCSVLLGTTPGLRSQAAGTAAATNPGPTLGS